MSNDKSQEDLQWDAYKDSLKDGDKKFLRSKWKSSLSTVKEFKPSENEEEHVGLTIPFGGEIKNVEVKKEKKERPSSHNKDKKKIKDKKRHHSKSPKKSNTNTTLLSEQGGNLFRVNSGGVFNPVNFGVTNPGLSNNITNNNYMTSEHSYTNTEIINSNINLNNNGSLFNPFEDEYENTNYNSLPYEIVPSYKHTNIQINTYTFNLCDKMRYNKILNAEAYINRFVLINQGQTGYTIAKIKGIIQEGVIELTKLDCNLKEEEVNINDSLNPFSFDSFPKHIVNLDETKVYLVEYGFSYNENNDKLAVVVSKFHTDPNLRDLLIHEAGPKKYEYSAFILEKGGLKMNDWDLIKVNSDNLFNLLLPLNSDINKDLCEKINQNLKKFLKTAEFGMTIGIHHPDKSSDLTHSSITQLKDYLHHEMLITKIKFSSVSKLCLLLQLDNTSKSIYIKNYKSEKMTWLSLEKLAQEAGAEIKLSINTLKGPVSLASLNNSKHKTSFYRNLKFKIQEDIPLDEANSVNKIVLCKTLSNSKSIMSEVECCKCTYKIGEFEYRLCRFCHHIFHIQCLNLTERSKRQISKGIEYWACQTCQPCNNCSGANTGNKLTCKDCKSSYHMECIEPSILEYYPVNPDYSKWKCQNCLKCLHCGKSVNFSSNTISRSPIQFGNNFELCKNCEMRIEKKEFCPICKKLWKEHEDKNMIECRCKFWVHKECDRILTDETFKKMTKKTYHCPNCRVNKKNRHIEHILQDIIRQDKNEYFYYPVDTNAVKNYLKIVPNPLSFFDMLNKLKNNIYLLGIEDFFSDVNLIFNNAINFNMPNSPVHKSAQQLLQICEGILKAKCSDLYQTSFEYYLFDHQYGDDHGFKQLQETLLFKFRDKVDLLKPRMNSIIHKLQDYKLNWPFINDFLERNFDFVYNMSSGTVGLMGDRDNYSLASESEKVGLSVVGSKIIVPRSVISQEDREDIIMTERREADACLLYGDNNSEGVQEDNVEMILNEEQIHPESNNLVSLNNTAVVSSHGKFQIKLVESVENKITISTPNLNPNPNYSSKNEINDLNLANANIYKDNQDNPETSINKKKERVKPKFLKTSDFQQELDTYNSNFEINRKATAKTASSGNVNPNMHKMEIQENPIDVLNPFLALEEEEDNIIKSLSKVKSSDNKISFIYPTKYKLYIDEDNKEEFGAYLDMMGAYVYMKDDKKRKEEKKKIQKEKQEDNYDYDENYEEPKAKGKKGRPSKKEESTGNNSVYGEDAFYGAFGGSKTTSKKVNKKLKAAITGSNNDTINIGQVVTNKLPPVANLIKTGGITSSINENRFKTEPELFDENINPKSLLPVPAQVCFTNTELIFENNCYLCGSFDDTNLFLTCSICFEHFHSYCISNSPLLTQNIDNIRKYNWKCQNCKFCECCKQNGNDNLLLYCDSCDRAMHTYCLDVKLLVVPESSWKCLECFQCQNCGSHKYYQNLFPLNPNKDYSTFTRNFNYCFECGMTLFHCAFCAKCQKSDFKKVNKKLIFIKTLEDFKKNEGALDSGMNISVNNASTLEEREKERENKENIIMVNCSICTNWFHADCLGLDEVNLKYYFQEYQVFNCLDCHIMKKYQDRYLEVTYIKYLEVLKMSYSVMCFSKLLSIILKSICRDSNIKLNSKLTKLFIKDNYNTFMKDKNLCMLLELIRIDVFSIKENKDVSGKKTKAGNTGSTVNAGDYNSANLGFNQKEMITGISPFTPNGFEKPKAHSYPSNKLPPGMNIIDYLYENDEDGTPNSKYNSNTNTNFNVSDFWAESTSNLKNNKSNKNAPKLNDSPFIVPDFEQLQKEVESYTNSKKNGTLSNSNTNTNKLDYHYLCRMLRKWDFFKLSKYFKKTEEKNKHKPVCVFDVNNCESSKYDYYGRGGRLMTDELISDWSDLMKKSLMMNKLKSVSSGTVSLNMNEMPLMKGTCKNNNSNDSRKNSKEEIQNELERENKMVIDDENANQDDTHKEISEVIIDKFDHLSKKKRKRLSFKADKKLKQEFENFFKKGHGNNSNTGDIITANKFVDFYNFDIEDFYKGGKGYKSSLNLNNNTVNDNKNQDNLESMINNTDKECLSPNTNESTSMDGNQLLTETIEKLEPYLNLSSFTKRTKNFLFNLILMCVIKMKQTLLKWLINQIMVNNSAEGNSNSSQNASRSNFHNFVTFHSLNSNITSSLETPPGMITPINFDNPETSEEEIFKFLDQIDPLEDSPSRHFSCEFCTRKGARRFSGRLIFIRNESWAHVNCLLWGKGIQEGAEGSLLNVVHMTNKVRMFKCTLCKKYGATISCENKKCGKNYHFICAHAKLSVFTEKRQFYCVKCAGGIPNISVENIFNTQRRFIVVRNPEVVNEYKQISSELCNFNPHSPNPYRIIPKFQLGLFNKYGNTTVIKFLRVGKRDLKIESIDAGLVKYISRNANSGNNQSNPSNPSNPSNLTSLDLMMISDSGIFFSELTFTKETAKDFEIFLLKLKLLNSFEQTNLDMELLRDHSKNDIINKPGELNLNLNTNFTAKDKTEVLSNPLFKKFNTSLEDYLKQFVLSEQELECSRRINKRYNDWTSFFNIFLPFNIIFKYQNLYMKLAVEFAENLVNSGSNEQLELKFKKESKNKLENYINTIKKKNNSIINNNTPCFKFMNYIETHQQSKIFKKALAEQDNGQNFLGSDKKHKNSQMYKNLNRTMSTNIMEADLPLAMKFRNYKSLKPRVTIGPSTIHRNGLYTTDSFQPGEIVIEYVGELITNKIADFREKEYNLRGFGDCYMFRLDQNYIIDATKYGNLARFINHCCDPNCSAQANQIGDKKHIILYAKRPIKAHEEITYDYNFECEQEKIMCRCGAPNCQGRLN